MHITRKQSIVFSVLVLVLFLGVGNLLIRRQRVQHQKTEPADSPAEPVQTPQAPVPGVSPDGSGTPSSVFKLNEFHRSETRNGKKVWEIKASRGQYFPEGNRAQVSDATLWIYRDNGETITLLAGQALIALDGISLRRAELSGGVTLNLNEKVTIKSDQAVYDRDEKTVISPGRVHIQNDNFEVEGDTLITNVETHETHLEGGITTVVKSPDQKSEEQ